MRNYYLSGTINGKMSEYQTKESQRRIIWKHIEWNALRNGHIPERKGWALYRRKSELLLRLKERWYRINWNEYAIVQRPEKPASFWEEGLSSLSEGEWAVAESQRGMMLNKVKLICHSAAPWKTGIFLRGRVELFIGGWVSCCSVPKRDDAE